ncbi:ATP-binding protein [Enterobacter asburiae]|uniref:ATP-binding protein n=1 Tax=Enterobacter asburiae TaxID=61645 RepID=UPI002075E5E8|nr:ATP-binding protein [Enterobacter asburiae]MCM7773475.1 ATP-binding protein [Enterobacter asburiae]
MSDESFSNKLLTVDVSPEVQIYRVLQHLSYGVETAFAELIDNSIQSYIEGRKLPGGGGLDERLMVCIDINENTIVLTDNARGINRTDIQRAVKPGFESNHDPDSLSIYGIGMKSAALWFSEDWSIKTSVPGEPYSLDFNFNLQRLFQNHSTTEIVNIEEEEADNHYTIITLRSVTRIENKAYYEKTVFPFLLETFVKFSPFLDIEIYYNNIRLSPDSKKLRLTIPDAHIYPVVNSGGVITGNVPIEWRIDFDFLYKNKPVRGFILLMETGGYGQPGIRLLRNNRVIEGTSVYPNIPDNLLGTKNKYAAQRIYGELNLDDFPVDFMKTRFNGNMGELFNEINNRLGHYHYNILKQATGTRKGEMNKPENKLRVEKMLADIPAVRADNPEPAREPEPEKETGTTTKNPVPTPSEGKTGSIAVGSAGQNGSGPASGKPAVPDPIAPSGGGTGFSGSLHEPFPENRIEISEALRDAFSRFPGDKLPQLYTSLCTISLRKHAVMCYVAAWSLLESWSSALGKKDTTDFISYLTPRLGAFESDRGKRNDFRSVIQEIHTKGNCNKHSGVFGNSHALDLKNYFIILEPFFIHETHQFFSNPANRTPSQE